MIPISLVVEDLLTKSVALEILKATGKSFSVNTVYDSGGFGYIKSKIIGFNSASKGCPYLVITDLDSGECAAGLIADWFGTVSVEHNLIFRVAVKEVESWILADRESFSGFLGIRADLIPEDTDTLTDPKASLVSLSAKCRKRSLRERIVPDETNIGAKQGPDYNGALIEFVQRCWRIRSAVNHSPSLKRAFNRIQSFSPKWSS